MDDHLERVPSTPYLDSVLLFADTILAQAEAIARDDGYRYVTKDESPASTARDSHGSGSAVSSLAGHFSGCRLAPPGSTQSATPCLSSHRSTQDSHSSELSFGLCSPAPGSSSRSVSSPDADPGGSARTPRTVQARWMDPPHWRSTHPDIPSVLETLRAQRRSTAETATWLRRETRQLCIDLEIQQHDTPPVAAIPTDPVPACAAEGGAEPLATVEQAVNSMSETATETATETAADTMPDAATDPAHNALPVTTAETAANTVLEATTETAAGTLSGASPEQAAKPMAPTAPAAGTAYLTPRGGSDITLSPRRSSSPVLALRTLKFPASQHHGSASTGSTLDQLLTTLDKPAQERDSVSSSVSLSLPMPPSGEQVDDMPLNAPRGARTAPCTPGSFQSGVSEVSAEEPVAAPSSAGNVTLAKALSVSSSHGRPNRQRVAPIPLAAMGRLGSPDAEDSSEPMKAPRQQLGGAGLAKPAPSVDCGPPALLQDSRHTTEGTTHAPGGGSQGGNGGTGKGNKRNKKKRNKGQAGALPHLPDGQQRSVVPAAAASPVKGGAAQQAPPGGAAGSTAALAVRVLALKLSPSGSPKPLQDTHTDEGVPHTPSAWSPATHPLKAAGLRLDLAGVLAGRGGDEQLEQQRNADVRARQSRDQH